MKHILTLLLCVVIYSSNAQNYKTHIVKPGETIETIAKTYLVTPFDIFALNPDAKTNFGENTTLIIPNSKVKNEDLGDDTRVIVGFEKHKVRRKETLYSLSKKYDVTIAEIKKANTSLYSENLRKGDRIQIPRYKTVESKQILTNTVKKHTVQQSEGKWRIAHKFGITVQELEDLNPNMKAVIQPGDVLNVPNIANNEELPTEARFKYYEVLPKEGFFRLKVKLGLTQQQLESLNPGLNETGLKAGMVLKLPATVDGVTIPSELTNKIDLRDQIVNRGTKRLALLLPFRLQNVNVDSVSATKEIMKSDKILSTALDFHSGVLMALDWAKELGISSDLKVFDTENKDSEIGNITAREDFSDYDAIIGPMMTKTFDSFVTSVNDKTVPVFAPLAKPTKVLANVYQTIPESDGLSKKMINFVKADTTKTQVVIISDQKHRTLSNALKQDFPNAKQLFSETKKGKDAYFIHHVNLQREFKKGKNVVFLETDNVGFGTSVISLLNGFISNSIEVILVTTDKSKAFESSDPDNNYHLSNLKFHYPTINRDFDFDDENPFVKAYKEKYKVYPNKYALRGFDLTLDILLRLSATDYNSSEIVNTAIETEYIENKFHYSKKTFGGFINEASYIVKFDNLKIIEAK